jgi:hypothetical protein
MSIWFGYCYVDLLVMMDGGWTMKMSGGVTFL